MKQVGVMKVRQCRFHRRRIAHGSRYSSRRARRLRVRIGPSRPVDPRASPIPLTGYAAGIASDGIDWLVLSSESSNWDSTAISAARVTADGTVLDQPSFVVAEAPTVLGASLAFDGSASTLPRAEYQAIDQA